MASPSQGSQSAGTPEPAKRPRRTVWVWVALAAALLAVNYWVGSRATQPAARVRVPYSPFFLNRVRAGDVTAITSRGTAIQGTFERPERYGSSRPTRLFETEIPAFADTKALALSLQRADVVVNAQPLQTSLPWWENVLFNFGPTLLFLGLLVLLMRRGSAQSVLGSFSRSTARRYSPDGGRITFADVAGIDEAKDELAEVVDFLREPDKYRRLGGRIPHGVLLSGEPGTGKTLLARAVAGEADVPFFSMAASEFVEAIVGVGAARVRDLFKEAKKAAPAIVFIDELDAVGGSRVSGNRGFSGGNDEREQTLNQILTEMDGFDSSTNVIVIGATNRPDVLDPALLRPGRFDRRVTVSPPDRNGREAILNVHARGVPLAPDVDLGRIAATTPGMVGADLANLVNEAALLAARRGRTAVTATDLADALERILLGAERKILMGEDDRRRTAYHEGGHALVGMLTPGADPVRKISVIPRGQALGVTFSAPDADRFNYQQDELEAKIRVALGGRAAEEVVFGKPSTGAESDLEQLTQIARHMVGRWGMSDRIGRVSVLPADGAGPLPPGVSDVSPHTHELVDEEVHRIVEDGYAKVLSLLRENRSRLDALASALLEHETLDEVAAYGAAGLAEPAEPVATAA